MSEEIKQVGKINKMGENMKQMADKVTSNVKALMNVDKIKVLMFLKKRWAQLLMIFVGITFFALFIGYSPWIRIPRYLIGLGKFIKYVDLQPIEKCLDYIKDYKLADFYVASSARSYLSGFQHNDFATKRATEMILKAGARFLEFEIYNKGFDDDTIPVVSVGKEEGNVLLTLNLLPFEVCCQTIAKYAFSDEYLTNHSDPLFINITLRTNNNINTINKVAELIKKYFGGRLLGNKYSYSRTNIAQMKLKDLIGKVVIFSDKRARRTKLYELVNYTWGRAFMKERSYEQIHETSDHKYLIGWNKRNITRVYPLRDVSDSSNYNPNIAWRFGCQFVSLNYQNFDDNMKDNIVKFSRRSFVLKPSSIRYKLVCFRNPEKQDPNVSLANMEVSGPGYTVTS